MILTKLNKSKNKVVGKKQTINVILEGKAERVFLAEDADRHILDEIYRISKENNVSIVKVDSKLRLGRACGIDVSAACAALLK
ncbi:MAG: ribosomal L7Ae/L30e/S12e/Gadd45 family protein [Halanaerobiales bacterium]